MNQLARGLPLCYIFAEVIQMLNMVQGCRVKDPSVLRSTLLYEGYTRIASGFAANVNAEKIQPLLESFVKLHNELCFIILEVPTNAKEETALKSGGAQPFHKDVYYLDGLTPEKAVAFLDTFGEWLIHDGMSSFGIGIHSGANEILVEKYNVVTIYTGTPQTYIGFFEMQDIREVMDLKTAWDYFSSDTPGETFRYEYQGKDVYDLVEHLKQYGLYFAERREV